MPNSIISDIKDERGVSRYLKDESTRREVLLRVEPLASGGLHVITAAAGIKTEQMINCLRLQKKFLSDGRKVLHLHRILYSYCLTTFFFPYIHPSSNSVQMDSNSIEPERQSVLKRIYRDNKGACLILLAEVAASSMDAIVRYLQQGRSNGMPAFQVRWNLKKPFPHQEIIAHWLTLKVDYFCTYEHYFCLE